MLYQLLGAAVAVAHLCFVAFVLFGALLVPRWPSLLWFHVPAVGWAVVVQLAGWQCPLTPAENQLRSLGGTSTYTGGFLDHYLRGTDEPSRAGAIFLGLLALCVNLALYYRLYRAGVGRVRA